MQSKKSLGLCLTVGAMLFSAAAIADETIAVSEVVRSDSGDSGMGPRVVSVRLDDIGLGVSLGGRFAPGWSWNAFGSTGETIDFSFFGDDNDERDVVKQYKFGGQLRWHFGTNAPSGGYLFGEVGYLNGKFKRSDAETGRTASDIEKGVKPAVGIGYMSAGKTLVWDVGGGFGSSKKYSASYGSGSNFESSSNALIYASLGIRL